MEIHVRSESRVVEIWLTGAEQRSAALQDRLKPLYAGFSGQNYLVAVFESGEQELYGAARDLLCRNRGRCARREAEEHRTQKLPGLPGFSIVSFPDLPYNI